MPEIAAGFKTIEPDTGTELRVIEGDVETQSKGWVLEARVPPGAGPFALEHLHTTWHERFDIQSGEAIYKLEGRQARAGAGEAIDMPAGQPHIHPWNASDSEPLVYRQTDTFPAPSPDALRDVIGAFATMFGLKRVGKADAKGLPANPLQLAATLRLLTKHQGYDAALPIFLQKLVAGSLGRLAEALGYRGDDPRYWDLEASG